MKITPPPGPVSPTAYTWAKLICEEYADEYEESAAIVAEILQVPAATKVTTPVDGSTVHTDVLALLKVFVPLPNAVAVSVGAVADMR